jgi:hypothetical protein
VFVIDDDIENGDVTYCFVGVGTGDDDGDDEESDDDEFLMGVRFLSDNESIADVAKLYFCCCCC